MKDMQKDYRYIEESKKGEGEGEGEAEGGRWVVEGEGE